MSAWPGHPPQPGERFDHRVRAGGVRQGVPEAEHDVKPLVDGVGQVRPQTLLKRYSQPFPPEPRRRDRDHRIASVGRPHAEAPPCERRRVQPGAAGRVEHGAAGTESLEQICHHGLVDRESVGQRVVVVEPVVLVG